MGGAPAGRGCLIEGERRLLWGELPLRGAARWIEGGGCFGGSSRCAGLLDRGREEPVSGGAAAARGCSIEGGRRLLGGSCRCAGLLDRYGEKRRLLLGELPLRGAAQLREGGGCFYIWGELPLRGAAQLREGGGCFWGGGGAPAARGCSIEGGRRMRWGSSRCAGLLDRARKNKGCFWGELPLRRRSKQRTSPAAANVLVCRPLLARFPIRIRIGKS